MTRNQLRDVFLVALEVVVVRSVLIVIETMVELGVNDSSSSGSLYNSDNF